MDALDRAKNITGSDSELAEALKFVGEDVQQDFRVRFGVDVTQIILEQFLFKLIGIRQIAIVSERDAVR